MKKIAYCLLLVWITLMSVGANAHATRDAAQEAFYTHDHAAHERLHSAAAPGEVHAIDTSHADTCPHSHCGHTHAAGLLSGPGGSITADTTDIFPASRFNWASSPATNNIDRPKWPVATPTVVSLFC